MDSKNKKRTPQPKRVLNPKKTSSPNPKQSKLSSSGPVTNKAQVPSTSVEETTTPPKRVDIETYYSSRGLSLSHVRRMNRNYVRHDGPGDARGIVFWDSYTPPEGYTVDDLPSLDSPSSQPAEVAVSPAILLAARYKMKQKPVCKSSNSTEEFDELFNKLTRRKNVPDKENTIIYMAASSTSQSEGSPNTFNPNSSASLFPEFDEDLDDSALVRCTQAAEKKFEEQRQCQSTSNMFSIVNLVDPLTLEKRVTTGQTDRLGPVSSITVESTSAETPRSVQSITRRSTRSKNQTNSSMSSAASSISEGSFVDSERSRLCRRSQRKHVPHRALFSKNEIQSEPLSTKMGDFGSDDDDDLFSQIEIPSLDAANMNKSKGANCKDKQSEVCDQTTIMLTEMDDSLLNNADFLTQIDKMEEMSLHSKVATNVDIATQVIPESPKSAKSTLRTLKRLPQRNHGQSLQ